MSRLISGPRLMLLITTLSLCLVGHALTEETSLPTYHEIAETFDPLRLGYGMEANGKGPLDQPMAYALIASAAAIKGDMTRARAAADWLVVNRSRKAGGWGLGWEWDAFNDGSVNPSDTSYGITTALAIEALTRVFIATDDSRYSDAAASAADYYKDFASTTPDGMFFWYSDQEADAKNVRNVSAMMLGAFALLGKVTERSDLLEIARSGLAELMMGAGDTDDGYSWRYTDASTSRPNDAVHAAYIVHGILLADRVLKDTVVSHYKLRRYLLGFISQDDGLVTEFVAREVAPKYHKVRARLWGVGMLAYVLAEMGELDAARYAFCRIKHYRMESGQYRYAFDKDYISTRATAHILLAAANIERRRP